MTIELDETTGGTRATVRGILPSEHELQEIVARRLPLWVLKLPSNTRDLRFLEPIASDLITLIIDDWIDVDLSQIANFLSLRELSLPKSRSRRKLDLSALAYLENFSGNIDNVRMPNISLKKVKIWGRSLGDLDRSHNELQSVELHTGKAANILLPSCELWPSLLEFRVSGAGSLDMGKSPSLHLVSVEATNVSEVRGVCAVVNRNNFKRLILEKVSSTDGQSCLGDASCWVGIIDSEPLPPSFLDSVAGRANWHFYPERRSSAAALGGADEDATRFRFLLHPAFGRPVKESMLEPDRLTARTVEWMATMSTAQQRVQLQSLWDNVLTWSASQGADVLLYAPVGSRERREVEIDFSGEQARRMLNDVESVQWLRIMKQSRTLVVVEDSLADGVVVLATSESGLPRV